MLEIFIVFAVLLLVIEAVIRYRRNQRILRGVDALNDLGRRRLP